MDHSRTCPDCGKEICFICEYEPPDYSVGVWGGYYCTIDEAESECICWKSWDQGRIEDLQDTVGREETEAMHDYEP